MNKDDLNRKLNISEKEIESAKYYFDLKGIELHNAIADYLQSYKSDPVRYGEVATAYRYDKRIRKVLYKFIGLLEEHIRAYISNKYSDNVDKLDLESNIKSKIEKGMSLFESLDEILFSQLISQVRKLDERDLNCLFPNIEHHSINLSALVELRNAVSHNRFLLNYLKFKPCKIDDDMNASLFYNLKNLYNHLGKNIQDEFALEIQNCSIESVEQLNEQKRKYQVEWNLLDDIKIVI